MRMTDKGVLRPLSAGGTPAGCGCVPVERFHPGQAASSEVVCLRSCSVGYVSLIRQFPERAAARG